MEDTKQVLSAILDAGEVMLMAGAEVSRVENTLDHMARAYGFTRVDVYTIIYSIVVTVCDGEGNIETQTRRIQERDTNMRKVERINALSRRVCRERMPLEEFKREIADIQAEKGYPDWVIFWVYGIAAGAFSIFFGGSIGDAFVSAVGGLVVRLALLAGQRLKIQNIVLTMLCSGIAGLVAVLLVRLGVGQSIDLIIIGDIMLLIPGIALTTSLRDMIRGDLISGLLGLCEAVIRALAIAIGLALVLWRFGGGL